MSNPLIGNGNDERVEVVEVWDKVNGTVSIYIGGKFSHTLKCEYPFVRIEQPEVFNDETNYRRCRK